MLSTPTWLSTLAMPASVGYDDALLLVDLVVLVALEGAGEPGELVVELGRLRRRARDDERRPGLVDEDRVDLVDDGVDVAALDHVLARPGHVVAQVVEAELGVGAVGDVARVGVALVLEVGELGADPAHGQPEEPVDLAHPVRVAAGQVVVHRDDVHAPPRQGVEVHGQGRDQGLALAGLHLGDPPEVQRHAPHELHVEVALAEHPPRRLAHGGEGVDEQVVEGLAVVEPLPEVDGPVGQVVVGQGLHLGLELVDEGNELCQPADLLSLAGPQDAVKTLMTPGVYRRALPAQRRMPARAAGPAGAGRSAWSGAVAGVVRPWGGRGSGGGASAPPAFPSTARPGARACRRPCPPPRARRAAAALARNVWPCPVMVTSHTLRPDPGASRSSDRRTSARSSTGVNLPSLATFACASARTSSGAVCLRPRTATSTAAPPSGRGSGDSLPVAADMFDACGSRPADLVFVPTLACRGVGGPVAGDGTVDPHRPTTPTTACFAPSPPNTESRCPDGQGLPLSRTMLSNHELPYVGRFACDWLRLATTDPDAIHDHSVRLDAPVVPGRDSGGGVPADASGLAGLGRVGDGVRCRRAAVSGAVERRCQVPVCQEPRYSSCAGVRRSMSTPMVSSLSRAISASMVRGTS